MNAYADIDMDLLLKYDKPGPRYTSYPTAPVWSDSFDHEDWHKALKLANEAEEEPLSLYVHIPYCENLCLYCGCSVLITRNHSKGNSYVDYLLEEVKLLGSALSDRRRLAQMHWGGGTPTFLPPDELVRLCDGIQEIFHLIESAEIGIEVDPCVTTVEHLRALRHAGFNRLSMGIQDFDPKVQQTVRRLQPKEKTKDLIDEARKLGFLSVNVDLIYGLPDQSQDGFGDTLDTIISWNVDRVACYSFAYVPWLKKHMKALPVESLPDRNAKLGLFLLALEKFNQAGYEVIGMDHFARPQDSLSVAAREGNLHRNFMGYTTRVSSGRGSEDMVMLGITSIGEVAGTFGQNKKDLKQWQDAIDNAVLPVTRGHKRSADDEDRRRIILDLMCSFGIEYSQHDSPAKKPFSELYEGALSALRDMQDDGLLEISDSGIKVTDMGKIFIRNIAMPFDAYLDEQQGQGKPIFSRTV